MLSPGTLVEFRSSTRTLLVLERTESGKFETRPNAPHDNELAEDQEPLVALFLQEYDPFSRLLVFLYKGNYIGTYKQNISRILLNAT